MATSKKTTYKFKSGTEVTGTVEEIQKIGKALGESVDLSGFYESSTHGLVKISEMATPHLRNAIVKATKDRLETIRKKKLTDKEFVNEYLNVGEDKTIVNLFTELNKRK